MTVQIKLDSREFMRGINIYKNKKAKAAYIRAMNDNGEDLVRMSGELVPVHKGVLLGSGTRVTNMRGGDVEVLVGYNESYAAKVHETMAPAPDPLMQPGSTTKNKPENEFGAAGGKYLSRPLFGKMKRYFQHVANQMKKVR